MSDRQWLEATFTDPEEAGQGRRALGQDSKAYYDSLALAARLGKDDVSEFEEAATEALFLGALDEMLAEEAPPAKKSWVPQLALVAGALIAGGALVWGLNSGVFQADDGFQARGIHVPAEEYGQTRVLPFCARAIADEIQFITPDQAPCLLSDELKLAYTSDDARLKYGHFLGVHESGELYWYGPSPAAPGALKVERAPQTPVPVGESIKLSVNHKAGTIFVMGVFAEREMEMGELESWAKAQIGALQQGHTPRLDRARVSVAELKVEAE